MNMKCFWMTVTLAASAVPPVSAADQIETLEKVRQMYAQGRGAIYSIRAKYRAVTRVRTQRGAGSTIIRTCQWLQRGPDYKWQLSLREEATAPVELRKGVAVAAPGPRESEMMGSVIDGKKSTIQSQKDANGLKLMAGSLGMARENEAQFIDLWSRAGFMVRDRPPVSLLDVLNREDWLKDMGIIETNSEKTVHIVARRSDGLNVEAWLSPKHCYFMTAMIVRHGENPATASEIHYRTHSFREHANGTVFPERTTMSVHRPGERGREPSVTTDTYFDSVTINSPVDISEIRVDIPEGTTTFDFTKQTRYVMGRDGQPSPEHGVRPLKEAIISGSAQFQPPHVHETHWWLTGMVVCGSLALVSTWFFLRRMKASAVRSH